MCGWSEKLLKYEFTVIQTTMDVDEVRLKWYRTCYWRSITGGGWISSQLMMHEYSSSTNLSVSGSMLGYLEVVNKNMKPIIPSGCTGGWGKGWGVGQLWLQVGCVQGVVGVGLAWISLLVQLIFLFHVQLLQSLDGVNENPSCHPLVGLVVREVEAVMVVQAVMFLLSLL